MLYIYQCECRTASSYACQMSQQTCTQMKYQELPTDCNRLSTHINKEYCSTPLRHNHWLPNMCHINGLQDKYQCNRHNHKICTERLKLMSFICSHKLSTEKLPTCTGHIPASYRPSTTQHVSIIGSVGCTMLNQSSLLYQVQHNMHDVIGRLPYPVNYPTVYPQ